jgi:Zn-dependent protease
MNPSLTLGRVAGVRIGLNWSWLVAFALIVWTLESSVFPSQNPHLARGAYVGMAVVAVIAFFASLLLRELGHALRAQREADLLGCGDAGLPRVPEVSRGG